jgi:hypothetical protein
MGVMGGNEGFGFAYPEMPTPAEGIDDEAGHKTTEADAAEETDEVNAHPNAAFVKEENICLNSGAKTFASRIREGTNNAGRYETVP